MLPLFLERMNFLQSYISQLITVHIQNFHPQFMFCYTFTMYYINICHYFNMQTSSLKDFQIIKKLGEGAFGQVYQVRRKIDLETYALKKVKMHGLKQKEKDNSINEIRILASLNNQNVIKFKQAFYDNDSGYLCIVMEYASGGDLLKMINNHTKTRCRIKQQQIWKAIYDIAKGLKSLHDKKILHRDLKSANIFIGADGSYKLGDLNVSKVLKKQLAQTQTGTPYYASPEVWKDMPYDSKSDIWSFGCIIYQMAALNPPFKATDLQGLYKKVKTGVFNAIPSAYSAQLSQFVNSMIKIDPQSRPSANQILRNPILRKNLGLKYEQNLSSLRNTDPLLGTIKFNPYNLRSLKQNLPKSTYESQENSSKDSSKNRLLFVQENKNRQRTLSQCGLRKIINSPVISSQRKNQKLSRILSKIQSPRISIDQHNLPSIIKDNHLPPIPGRKYQRVQRVDTSSRLRRIGRQVIESNPPYNNKARVHSLHK